MKSKINRATRDTLGGQFYFDPEKIETERLSRAKWARELAATMFCVRPSATAVGNEEYGTCFERFKRGALTEDYLCRDCAAREELLRQAAEDEKGAKENGN